jgi:hypothetical protein
MIRSRTRVVKRHRRAIGERLVHLSGPLPPDAAENSLVLTPNFSFIGEPEQHIAMARLVEPAIAHDILVGFFSCLSP